MVREELNAEEQFFEQAVKTERFVKKYKKPLIGLVVAAGLIVAGTAGYDAYTASKRAAANEAFLALQKNPSDAAAADTLQAEAPLLYDAWRLSVAVKNADVKTLQALGNSGAPEVADISRYEAAALEENAPALDGYAAGNTPIYREMALIDEAVLLIRDGKVGEAHRRLQMIDSASPVYPLATALMHYGVK